MSEDKSREEIWTCMGVRVGAGDKRVTAWRDPEGKTRRYVEKLRMITGGIYAVQVTRKDGGVYRGEPVYRDHLPYDHPDRKLWLVQELEAEQELARLARERKAKAEQNSPFDEAMGPLLEYAKACRTTAQRDALIADVIRRLSIPWNRP